MQLRVALNDYKFRRGHQRFPEERRTTNGAFSGLDDRLVYIDRNGQIRDYSYPLCGLYGVERSRVGLSVDGHVTWFDQLAATRQHYYGDTALVETELDAGAYTVHQFDLTVGSTHFTHIELRGEVPADAEIAAAYTFAPNGSESRTGQLHHDDVVEVFHKSEHDYVTASTGLSSATGQLNESFDEMASTDSVPFPRPVGDDRYEVANLSPTVLVTAPIEQEGRVGQTTLVTHLANHEETTRTDVLSRLNYTAEEYATTDDIRDAAREQLDVKVPDGRPLRGATAADIRTLELLSADTGAHMAGPDFDPFYAYSGGYGYTWFRDDAEIARFMLEAGEGLALPLSEQLSKSAAFYCQTQLDDGTWPHRVWPSDGEVAPGWAHARLEEGSDGVEYQADQSASVVSFLSTYLRTKSLDEEQNQQVRQTICKAVTGLDETLEDDDLPTRCQNAWENMDGRFTHTAATYLQAYSAAARAPLPKEVREHARKQAARVYEALDDLWVEDREVYALREDRGELDDRLDSATFALVEAHREYEAVKEVEADRLDRLYDHLTTTIDGLRHQPSRDVRGLVRFEGDRWRTDDQDHPKLWSVSTGWGANAAAHMAILLGEDDERYDELLGEAADLFELLLPSGPFATESGLIAEQIFDSGEPDSATPLGWSHALRLRTTALLDAHDALPSSQEVKPKGPDVDPAWTTAEKYGVGTVADHGADDASKVWFTLTEGAMTEVRFPRIDLMNLRTVDFLVVDADEKSSYTARTHNERRQDDDTETIERYTEMVESDSLAFRQTIAEIGDGQGHEWTLTAEYATDPDHDAILVDYSFTALDDNEYDVFVVTDCALTNSGLADRGYRLGDEGEYHLAARDAGQYDSLVSGEGGLPYSVAAAVATEDRFDWATVGVAGHDHLHRLFSDGEVPESHETVDNENVVLVGRCATSCTEHESTVGIGFAEEADTAAALGEASGALTRGFETVREEYDASWQAFLDDKDLPDSVAGDTDLANQYRASLMSIKAAEDKTYHGAGIASPSVPWGEAVRADEPRGYGYNFVWSRDLYQTFSVFDAVGDLETAQDNLEYIYEYQQDEEGFIPQNTYLDGRTRWGGEQMDNISFPAVMAWHLYQQGVTFEEANYDYWNVRASADYVVRNGPHTNQERWEEEAGYSPSSIAAEITGLACAADIAAQEGEQGDALVYLALADRWVDEVEDLCVTYEGTDKHDPPYYVRISRNGDPDSGMERTLANNGPTLDERDIIDAGFLELVRLGAKPADDSIVENSVDVVDDTIRVDTPYGPAFYRYNGDGYGELMTGDEGAPWGIHQEGKGRLWPIFTGERAEYELAKGTDEGPLAPENMLATMEGFANSGRMLAEQVWDREHETEYNWEFGEGTGAATPLEWSMAQYVRLAHGIDNGEPIETPSVLKERYADAGGTRDYSPNLEVTLPGEEPEAQEVADGGTVTISGKTDGIVAAVKTHRGTQFQHCPEGRFEFDIPAAEGTHVTVATSTEENPFEGDTSVERFLL